MAEYSKEFLEKTIKTWQSYSPVPLTMEDAREIAETMTGVYALLLGLEQKYGKEEKKS